MKLLILDSRPKETYAEILEECRIRKIEVQIETDSISVMRAIDNDKDKNIDGIIMNLELPANGNEPNVTNPREGEKLIRDIHRKELKIPILVFSQKETKVNYPYVFYKMSSWQKDSYQFFEFIKYVHLFKLQKGRLQ